MKNLPLKCNKGGKYHRFDWSSIHHQGLNRSQFLFHSPDHRRNCLRIVYRCLNGKRLPAERLNLLHNLLCFLLTPMIVDADGCPMRSEQSGGRGPDATTCPGNKHDTAL
ncbi:MAG: hypothetical protein IMW89_11445 [Ktedonobacteraceae bacterium]|nr:hypothetical protein [Ktedonobacteraceae bacterium]